MKKLLKYGVALAPSLTLGMAQSTEEDVPSDALVVIGSGETSYELVETPALAGSKDVITLDELAYEHPTDTLELFSKVPGVNIARYNQGIINTDVGIRGFGTDGVTPHAKTLIDGIPMNLHNGYNELDQMFSMGIGSIEVFKGTSDPRYGMYNVAGSYNVFSRTDVANELQLTLDSFGSTEAQIYSGSQVGDLTQNYFFGYRNAEGYRDHDDTEKYSFSGRWAYELDDSLTVGASARFSGYEGDAPGYLDTATARSNPKSSADYSSDDSGEKEVNSFSVFADKEFFDAGVTLSLKAYHNDVFRERFVQFNPGWGLRHRIDEQTMTGFVSHLNWNVSDAFSLKAGFDYQRQDVVQKDYAVSEVGGPVTGRTRQDQDFTLDNFGGYLSTEFDNGGPFRANVGVRMDKITGEGRIHNEVRDAAGVRQNVYSQEDTELDVVFQPKVNLFYDVTDQLTTFANYGRTFQSPIGKNLFSTPEPNINDGGEVGMVYNFSDRSNVRFSLWQQVAEDEYQAHAYNGGYESIGEVERKGLELAFNYAATDKLTLWGNYSYTQSEIIDGSSNPATSFPNAEGSEVRSTPNHVYSLGASYEINDNLTARLSLDGQGDYEINEQGNAGRYGDYNIVNLGVDYATSNGIFSVQVNNLFDSYYEYVYDFSSPGGTAAPYSSPGDGINASISYKYEF